MLEKINPEFPQTNYILSCHNRHIDTKLFNKYTHQSINETNYTDKFLKKNKIIQTNKKLLKLVRQNHKTGRNSCII